MEYISAAEAAEKWGVSQRQVQRLLAGGKIPGARKHGRDWLIPARAEKPGGPRRGKTARISLASDLDYIIAAADLPMPQNNPDAVLDTAKDERIRLQYEIELAYLRGDFESAICLFQKTGGDDAAKLRACSTALAAAMSTGNNPLYKEIETYLKSMVRADMGANVTAVAELSLDTAYISAFAPDLASDWLKNGDFTALPPQAKPVAAFQRARYYQCAIKFERMLDVAQTALSFIDTGTGITIRDIYLRLTCAAACCGLGRIDEARRYVSDAANACLPHGFITPFVESMISLGGLFEQHLERDFPERYDAVMRQFERVGPNWLMFHNQFTKDNLKLILTVRESQIAVLAGRRVPYKQIAKQLNTSAGSIKNTMQIIYEKLHINNREDLYKLHLEP